MLDSEDSTAASATNSKPIPMDVARVSIRVPPFWPAKPSLWFEQLEAQFAINGITGDSTRYYYVIGNLEAKYVNEIEDLLINPPATDRYVTVKNTLIKRLSISQEQKTRQLLEREELGDRRPSQFLRHLRSLGGSTITDTLLRTLWEGRLPAQVQAVLAPQTDISLDKLAEVADKVIEVIQPGQMTHASLDKSLVDVSAREGDLRREIQELRREISRMQSNFHSRSPSSSSRQNFSRFRSKSRDRVDKGLCWYHQRFADKAKRCREPCKFASKNEKGSH